MEWMNRGNRPAQPVSQQPINGVAPTGVQPPKKKRGAGVNSVSVSTIILLIASTILIAALVALIAFGGWNKGEARYVDDSKMQAVFLNGGQVYFGKVKSLNSEYMRLEGVYYLRVNQQVQPGDATQQAANDISLVKLGCELHGPQDQMIIKSAQVIFWENLKSDGQVAKAVDEYVKQNPNGQQCADPADTPSTGAPAATPANNSNREE